jgi:signal transduction histidine kinase
MGSHRGVLRASKADLNRCADGQSRTVRFQSYGKAEGLASLVCSGGFEPGACRTADGLLWFPTLKGLAIIDPVNVTTNPVAPPVVIEELMVDGDPIEFSRNAFASGVAPVQIGPGKQSFEIRFTGLSFAAPEKVLFKYKLDGLERAWVDAGTKRFAQYSYLPPGDYAFHVMACNNDEVWNENGAALAFTVLPWFWQTWLFRLAAVATGAGLVGGSALWIGRRRVRARLAQLERQQAVERERARIARDIHDDLGASLTRITLLSQTVRAELEGQQQAAADLDQIYGTARELTRAMDEIVWAVNPRHDSLDSLVTYLGRFAQNFLSAAGLRCRLDVPLHLPAWPLTAEIRHNAFLAFKEALHNAVKHARASEVRISLELSSEGFVLIVGDNGCGFELNGFKDGTALSERITRLGGGNGLVNMRKRLEEIGGRCDWDTAPGEGTRVKLVIAVKT